MLALLTGRGWGARAAVGARALSQGAARRVERKLNKREWASARKAAAAAAAARPTGAVALITSASTPLDVAAYARDARHVETVRKTLARALVRGNEPVRSLIVGTALGVPVAFATHSSACKLLADALTRAATPAERGVALDELSAHAGRLAYNKHASATLQACLAALPPDAAAPLGAAVCLRVLRVLPVAALDAHAAALLAGALRVAPAEVAERLVLALAPRAHALAAHPAGSTLVCAALAARADGARLGAADALAAELLEAPALAALLRGAGEAAAAPRLAVLAALARGLEPGAPPAAALARAVAPVAVALCAAPDGAGCEQGGGALVALALAAAGPPEALALATALADGADALLAAPHGGRALAAVLGAAGAAGGGEAALGGAAARIVAAGLAAIEAAVAPLDTPTAPAVRLQPHTARALSEVLACADGGVCARFHASLLPHVPALARDGAGSQLLRALLESSLAHAASAELLRAIGGQAEALATDAHGSALLRAALAHAQAAPHMDGAIAALLDPKNAPLRAHRVAAHVYAQLTARPTA